MVRGDEEKLCHRCGDPATDESRGMKGESTYYCRFHYEEMLRKYGVKIAIIEIPKLRGCECLMD